jgi:pimeloyl-ACP methyl ester carboxylesterase
MNDNAQPQPFRISVSDEMLANIKERVANYPWHYMPDDGGWEYGTNLDYLKTLCTYWVEEFDWRKQEANLNKFPQFTANVDGLNIHFIHVKGSGPSPKPLLISHGWPGSVSEFQHIIEPLAHPERFGGRLEDAFDIIAPSHPGFGFSDRPSRPMGPRAIADILAKLMVGNLGYDTYIAQGGDWGSVITSWLGYEHGPNCEAIHINALAVRHPDGPQTPEEQAWAQQFEHDQIMQNGYRTIQATKPQTLSYAMNDSPVGTAAWIIEKFHGWSDIQNNNVESAHTRDELLTNIMIYIVTGSFNSASWIYYGRREEGGRTLSQEGRRVETPTGCAVFPQEMLRWPPRSYVDRMYNVTHWTQMPSGGHFGAMEEPKLLIEDIRAFARVLSDKLDVPLVGT